ncbi:tigger transposable element-derived protein 6-like [Anthonomus grandis grandis]|uniref:tigger transposable element-derived protein 6-like n=1 Tax=Anthonomus grandis grandis TaxID=2921223 RepID=UPI0021669AC4|nr:tigger transposable element-derived protein 6-like [Anthonomus grandis grandis]
MEGQKEKPLVIGKTAKPRAFKNINVKELPVTYRWNKKAWMTGELMAEWLNQFDEKMMREKREILLFLDNACCHPKDIRLKNIKLIFLPPNCTSIVQPLDQGIIKGFKTFYRTIIIKKLLLAINTAESAQELARKIHVLDAIYFINIAWDQVTKKTVQNCFIKSGITHSNSLENRAENLEMWENEHDIPLSLLAQMLRNKDNFGMINNNDINKFFNVDNDLILEQINDLSLDVSNQEEVVVSSDESEEEHVEEEEVLTTYQQAFNMTQLKRFTQARGDLSALDLLSKLDLHFKDTLLNKKNRQTSLLEYFNHKQ